MKIIECWVLGGRFCENLAATKHLPNTHSEKEKNLNRKLHAGLRSGGLLLLTLLFALANMAAARAADNPKITMVVAKRGAIVMELYPDMAPKTVAHIVELVKQKFYDGIKIHRVVDFCVQWGDPKSKNLSPDQFDANLIGAHDSGHPVPLEAKMLHEKYTLGLARSQDRNSGDCQIFINKTTNHRLDGDYCAFGKILKGTELVDKLAVGDVITSVRLDGAKETGKDSKKK